MKYAAKQKTEYKVQKSPSGKTVYSGNSASEAKSVCNAYPNAVISFRSENGRAAFGKANRPAFT